MQSPAGSAVVLAAGEGNRLAPLTNTRPKPMLPAANRPILEYVFEAIVAAGIDEIVCVVGYKQERIRNHFGDGDAWDCSITYVEQETQLGTGHALLQVEDVVDGRFLVLNGDRIIDAQLIDGVRAQDAVPAMAITRAEFPSTFGVVDLEGDSLVGIEEKPVDPSPSAQINAGVYCFDHRIFDAIRGTPTVDGERPITDTLNRIRAQVEVVRYDGTWLDVTYLWDLLPVNARQVTQAGGLDEDTVTPAGTSIAQDVRMARSSRIGVNASIRGGTSIGENVQIGPNVVIENAILLSDVEVGAGTVLMDTVVGANATVGPNVTIEGGEASVRVDGSIHDGVTLGAVIGDNAHVGGGTVLAPGSIVGDGATVASGARISGIVPPNTTVQRG